MDRILKIFMYAGRACLLLAFLTIVSGLVRTCIDDNEAKIAINVMEKNPERIVRHIDGAIFTDLHIGRYEFKPTFIQMFILSNDSGSNRWSLVSFCIILGGTILFLVRRKPATLAKLSEEGLGKFVFISLALYLVLKALFMVAIDRYILSLTNYRFGAPKIESFDIEITILILIVIERVISSLLSYSKKLKEENDLTI